MDRDLPILAWEPQVEIPVGLSSTNNLGSKPSSEIKRASFQTGTIVGTIGSGDLGRPHRSSERGPGGACVRLSQPRGDRSQQPYDPCTAAGDSIGVCSGASLRFLLVLIGRATLECHSVRKGDTVVGETLWYKTQVDQICLQSDCSLLYANRVENHNL